MKVLTRLNPIGQSIGTNFAKGQTKGCKGFPYFVSVLPMKDNLSLFLALHVGRVCGSIFALCMVMGRRVCGKSKRWAIENVFGHC